jgi:sugar phosphate isomerase/epimerase
VGNAASSRSHVRVGVVMEAFLDRPLAEVGRWLAALLPSVTDLEVGTGGYAPHPHCDTALLLRDAGARRSWLAEVRSFGLSVGALNAWGNPLHPDPEVAREHDAALRDTIRLAAALGVDRVVALSGCPAGAPGDRTPHFAGGGWLPYLEGITERQWQDSVEPYWSEMAEFARREHPELLICLELHPGTVTHNVETFERLAGLGDSIAANLDPSHFFWMQMDALAVAERLGPKVGHCHGKDVQFNAERLALNGLLDRRWPRPAEEMPWNFSVVGRGKDAGWWSRLVGVLLATSRTHTIAIEHEDPFVDAEVGVAEAAAVLAGALG